ncbi:MAG TPA: methyltransferase domain-containing protein [Ktedonobacteraceae bacterium]|jgi:SAM-dependent methyltransferase|nr:methyltransferase domain-containing protein [Ktedonobacteraceae bacterium]
MSSNSTSQERFNERYRTGNTPWDSGITPPELMEAVMGENALPAGRMLDIGCGTGTNCLTLALLGWHTVGVDFSPLAIEQANKKADAVAQDIARAGGSTRFIQADVTQLVSPAPDECFSLLLDLGCLNGISPDLHERYAQAVAQHALPGALFLLYAHLPTGQTEGLIGCAPEEIDRLFAKTFQLERREFGSNPQGGQSMWNWLRRRP